MISTCFFLVETARFISRFDNKGWGIVKSCEKGRIKEYIKEKLVYCIIFKHFLIFGYFLYCNVEYLG